MSLTVHETEREPLHVVIAGAGVAALECALALHALAAGRVSVEILTPTREFAYRPLSVAEPFGIAKAQTFDVDLIAAEAGATVREGSLAGVDRAGRAALTTAGDRIRYDALVLAIGTRARDSVPGALTFTGGAGAEDLARLLRELESGAVRSVAFVVPGGVSWSLPVYELALMTAERLRGGGIADRRIVVVTPEDAPLALFGEAASGAVEAALAKADVEVVPSTRAVSFAHGRLEVEDGEPVAVDRVVALPALEVPPLEGVPQGQKGFIATDPHGRVDGMTDVYAVGDAAWFPIKQGGIAAQQADLAAAAIAAEAGADVELDDAPLVLRGALLTGAAPLFMRNDSAGAAVATTAPLWWPPGKIAGRHLAPLVARLSRNEQPAPPLADLDQVFAGDPEAAEAGHREALALALAAADAEAGWGDLPTALRWLDVAEQLNVTLPQEYVDRRARWRAEAHPPSA